MLFGQIADHRVEFGPYQRFGDEASGFKPARAYRSRLAMNSGVGAMRSRLRPDTETGGSWKKSPDKTTWMPPNGRGSRRYFAADLVDHVEQPSVQHGNLVNDEDVRGLNLAFAPGLMSLSRLALRTVATPTRSTNEWFGR